MKKNHILAVASLLLANACVGVIEEVASNGGGGDGPGAAGAAGSDITTSTGGSNVTTSGATTSAVASTTGSPMISGGAGGSTGTAVGSGTAGSDGVDPDAGAGGGGANDDAGSTRRDGAVAGDASADAGSGSTSDSGMGGATFAQVRAIVQRNCGNCHGNFATFGTLTTHAVGRCGNDTLARANDPANSAFLELVQGQCGGFLMPRGCSKAPCISATDIQTFTSWIAAGARNN